MNELRFTGFTWLGWVVVIVAGIVAFTVMVTMNNVIGWAVTPAIVILGGFLPATRYFLKPGEDAQDY